MFSIIIQLRGLVIPPPPLSPLFNAMLWTMSIIYYYMDSIPKIEQRELFGILWTHNPR